MANPTAKQILESPDNTRGRKFDPTWTYQLVKPYDLPGKLDAGFKVLVEKVDGRQDDEKFVLIGKPNN